MKKALLFPLFLAATILALPGQAGQGGEGSFDWSLVLLNQGESVSVSTERPVKLQTGDRISFSLKSGADCFVSVIVRDAEGAVAALYSNPLRSGQSLTLGPMRITPPPGRETVFFVLSSREKPGLERVLDALKANPGSVRAGRDLLDQVYGLRREISQLRENPERPLAMGGSIRGAEDSSAGILFSGADTYVKILILEH